VKLFGSLFLVFAVCTTFAADKVRILPVLAADIRQGELANGLRYFIKPNAQPAAKVELRLLVNVGSMSEADDERGVAHLLEHMAFRRTKHFTQGQVKAFLDGQGMRFGSDSNAMTTHEYTQYELSVERAAAPKALQLMADWASGIELDPAELALERDVVLSEGRQQQNALYLVKDYLAALYPAYQYQNHLPIGDVDIVKTISLAKMKAFYTREYQAQRMTLFIAGDIQPNEIETQIKTLFAHVAKGDLPANYTPPLPAKGLRVFSSRSVESLPVAAVDWTWILPAEAMSDADAALRDFQHELIGIVLKNRLMQQSGSKDSALLDAGWKNRHSINLPARQTEFGFVATVKGNRVEPALRELYRELERARRFGFSQEEVASAYKIRKSFNSSHLDHKQWVDQLFRHMRYGESARDLAAYAEQYVLFFAATQPEDLQQELARLLALPDQLTSLLSPTTVLIPKFFHDKNAMDLVQQVQAEAFENTRFKSDGHLLMSTLPQPGKIVSASRDITTGGTLWKLANGIEVLTIPPKSSTEKIGYAARANGGMALLGKDQQAAGLVLNQYLLRAGLGDMTFNQLLQKLQLHQLVLMPYIYPDQHGLSGYSEPAALEALLQVQYLALTSFRSDEEQLQISKDIAYQGTNAYSDFLSLSLNANRYGEGWPYPRQWGRDSFDATPTALMSARQQLFGNPGAFRFVLTGVANTEQTEALIKQYFGSLPAQAVKAAKPDLLKQHVSKELSSVNNQAGARRNWQVYIPLPATSANAWQAEAMVDLITQRLLKALRENTGETYQVNSRYEIGHLQGVMLSFSYNTDIKQCQQAAQITVKEIARLLAEAPTQAEVQSIRDKLNKSIADQVNDPMQYANSRSWHWVANDSLAESVPPLDQFTPESMHALAKQWLKPSHWSVGKIACTSDADLSAWGSD
jgi:zinc protease